MSMRRRRHRHQFRMTGLEYRRRGWRLPPTYRYIVHVWYADIAIFEWAR